VKQRRGKTRNSVIITKRGHLKRRRRIVKLTRRLTIAIHDTTAEARLSIRRIRRGVAIRTRHAAATHATTATPCVETHRCGSSRDRLRGRIIRRS